jgi:uncharacterized phage infection (PIP) family protein YhgE
MLQKRFDQEYEGENRDGAEGESTVAALETTRSITSTPVSSRDPKKDEERISLFWRVFGGTILSIVALIFITLYNNLASTISDLRNDLSREREARAALAKKDDVDAIVRMQFERIRSVEGYKSDIEAIKERVTAAGMASETTKKDLIQSFDSLKKETAGLEVLKERIAAVEILKKDVAGFDALKDKLTSITSDLKLARDEAQKVQQELEKNKVADLERKTAHDAKAKQLDEMLKELQTGVQACREKIARLEGSQPTPAKPKTNP